MKFDQTQKVRLTCEFFIRLAETAINREDQRLVAGFFDSYQPLSITEALQLEQEMSKMAPAMAREKEIEWSNPFIRLGIERGRRQGILKGQQREIDLVLRQLKRRFGHLTASQGKTVRALNLRRVEALGEALLEFNSRADLDCWLKAHSR